MTRQTHFEMLLAASRFDEARDLLQTELAGGRLLDPRSDPFWPRFADRLAGEIQEKLGVIGVVDFWESLRDFFIQVIEPVWGHAHKGHIYFRLGLASLPLNLERGKRELEAAYQEDIVLENAGGGTPEAWSQSAYVALVILERIDDSEFANQDDKQSFIEQLFHSFDAAITGATVPPDLVDEALTAIAPPAALPSCQAPYRELQEATNRRMPFATVSLTGTVLEALILADLYYRRGITKLPNGRDVLEVELGPLLEEAIRIAVFPSDSVRVAFRLVHIFRNRVHPGNEIRQIHKLVPRVAWTIKVFFELAVLNWRKAFP